MTALFSSRPVVNKYFHYCSTLYSSSLLPAVNDYRILERHPSHTPDNPLELQKWRILNRLHDRNETLYYKVLYSTIQ